MSLSEFSAALSARVAAAGPAVVHADTRRRSPTTGTVWKDGLVLVPAHALEREDDLSVTVGDEERPATLVGADPGTDLALLRVDTTGAAAPDWAADALPDTGALVLVVARPGRATRASLGVVAARSEGYRTRAGGRLDAGIDVDVRAYPGWSGGLVIDVEGRVVGLATTALSRAPAVIPAATVRRVAAQLEEGRVRRAWLGVATQPVRVDPALGQPLGLLVVAVQPESPSAGKLFLGDALLAIDGAAVRSVGELLDKLDGERIGATATLKVLRAGAVTEVPIVLGAR